MENKAIIMNKYESIERYINRINEEYANDPSNLENYTKADAIMLNLQRACELTIDIAGYVVSMRKLGMPQTKKEIFDLLLENKLIDEKECKNMKGMIDFRNIALYDYQEVDEEILKDVLENHINDLLDFARKMLNI